MQVRRARKCPRLSLSVSWTVRLPIPELIAALGRRHGVCVLVGQTEP